MTTPFRKLVAALAPRAPTPVAVVEVRYDVAAILRWAGAILLAAALLILAAVRPDAVLTLGCAAGAASGRPCPAAQTTPPPASLAPTLGQPRAQAGPAAWPEILPAPARTPADVRQAIGSRPTSLAAGALGTT